MPPRLRTVLAVLVASALVAAAVGWVLVGGLVRVNPFDHVKVETFDSRTQAHAGWSGVVDAPAWIPRDASEVVRTARTDAQDEVLSLDSAEALPTAGCRLGGRTDEPRIRVPDQPSLPRAVLSCGGWKVTRADGRWFAWLNTP